MTSKTKREASEWIDAVARRAKVDATIAERILETAYFGHRDRTNRGMAITRFVSKRIHG
jgi:hypothetical protein